MSNRSRNRTEKERKSLKLRREDRTDLLEYKKAKVQFREQMSKKVREVPTCERAGCNNLCNNHVDPFGMQIVRFCSKMCRLARHNAKMYA